MPVLTEEELRAAEEAKRLVEEAKKAAEIAITEAGYIPQEKPANWINYGDPRLGVVPSVQGGTMTDTGRSVATMNPWDINQPGYKAPIDMGKTQPVQGVLTEQILQQERYPSQQILKPSPLLPEWITNPQASTPAVIESYDNYIGSTESETQKNVLKHLGLDNQYTLPKGSYSHNVPFAIRTPDNTYIKAESLGEMAQAVMYAAQNKQYLNQGKIQNPTIVPFKQWQEKTNLLKALDTPAKQNYEQTFKTFIENETYIGNVAEYKAQYPGQELSVGNIHVQKELTSIDQFNKLIPSQQQYVVSQLMQNPVTRQNITTLNQQLANGDITQEVFNDSFKNAIGVLKRNGTPVMYTDLESVVTEENLRKLSPQEISSLNLDISKLPPNEKNFELQQKILKVQNKFSNITHEILSQKFYDARQDYERELGQLLPDGFGAKVEGSKVNSQYKYEPNISIVITKDKKDYTYIPPNNYLPGYPAGYWVEENGDITDPGDIISSLVSKTQVDNLVNNNSPEILAPLLKENTPLANEVKAKLGLPILPQTEIPIQPTYDTKQELLDLLTKDDGTTSPLNKTRRNIAAILTGDTPGIVKNYATDWIDMVMKVTGLTNIEFAYNIYQMWNEAFIRIISAPQRTTTYELWEAPEVVLPGTAPPPYQAPALTKLQGEYGSRVQQILSQQQVISEKEILPFLEPLQYLVGTSAFTKIKNLIVGGAKGTEAAIARGVVERASGKSLADVEKTLYEKIVEDIKLQQGKYVPPSSPVWTPEQQTSFNKFMEFQGKEQTKEIEAATKLAQQKQIELDKFGKWVHEQVVKEQTDATNYIIKTDWEWQNYLKTGRATPDEIEIANRWRNFTQYHMNSIVNDVQKIIDEGIGKKLVPDVKVGEPRLTPLKEGEPYNGEQIVKLEDGTPAKVETPILERVKKGDTVKPENVEVDPNTGVAYQKVEPPVLNVGDKVSMPNGKTAEVLSVDKKGMISLRNQDGITFKTNPEGLTKIEPTMAKTTEPPTPSPSEAQKPPEVAGGTKTPEVVKTEPVQPSEVVPKTGTEVPKVGKTPEVPVEGQAVSAKMAEIDTKLTEVKAKIKTHIDEGVFEIGGINDPRSKAAYDDLMEAAKLYIQKGILTVDEFARELGIKVNDLVQRAWDRVQGQGSIDRLNEVSKNFDEVWGNISAERQVELKQKAAKLGSVFKNFEGEEARKSAQASLQGALTDMGLTPDKMTLTPDDLNKLTNVAKASDEVDVFDRFVAIKALERLQQEFRIPRPYEREQIARIFGLEADKLFGAVDKPRLGDYLTEIYYNSLITVKSNIPNTVGNTIAAVWSPIERGAAGILDIPLAKLQSRTQARFVGESAQDLYGAWNGIADGARAWLDVMKTGKSDLMLKGEAPTQAFKGKVGAVINFNTRLLSATDQLFKSINQSAALYAESYRIAKSEKLSGQALKIRLDDLINNPTDELLKKTAEISKYRLYQKQSNLASMAIKLRDLEVGKGIQPLRIIMPFVRTPVNLVKFGLERSPFAALDYRMWQGIIKGKPEATDQIARWVLGSLISASIAIYAKDGLITSAAPDNPADRDEFYRMGKQPYSLKIGNKWISYQRLEPFNQMFVQVGNVLDAIQNKKPDKDVFELAGNAVASFMDNIASQTFLSGLSNIVSVLKEPERYGETFIQRILTSAIPGSGTLRIVAQALDPVIRQSQNIGQAAEAIIPGLSQNVPPKINVLGETQKRETPSIVPYTWTTETDSPINKMLEANDVTPGFAGNTVGNIKLNDEQTIEYRDLVGDTIKKKLERIVSDEVSNRKRKQIETTIDSARDEAKIKYLKVLKERGITPPK